MAISSPIKSNGLSSTNNTAVKAKALAVRTSISEPVISQQSSYTDRSPELAEQLNEETKQKYVKGQ